MTDNKIKPGAQRKKRRQNAAELIPLLKTRDDLEKVILAHAELLDTAEDLIRQLFENLHIQYDHLTVARKNLAAVLEIEKRLPSLVPSTAKVH